MHLRPLKKAILLCLSAGILFCITYSCKKSSSVAPTTTTTTTTTSTAYYINYTGSCYLGSTITFTSNAPAGSTLLWKFSDSTTSIETSPSHVFPSSGIYSVKLIINNDSVHYIYKSVGIGLDSSQMPVIAGTKTWSHNIHFQAGMDTSSASGFAIDTIYHHADTTFPVSRIDGGSIRILNDTLEFWKTGGDTTLYFAAPMRGFRIYPKAIYFRNTGKIEYYIEDLISSGSTSTETYNSY